MCAWWWWRVGGEGRGGEQVMAVRFRDFLAPFATAAVNAYLQKPLSCILYAVTTVVSTFGRLEALILKSPLYVPLCSKGGRALTFQNVACRSFISP